MRSITECLMLINDRAAACLLNLFIFPFLLMHLKDNCCQNNLEKTEILTYVSLLAFFIKLIAELSYRVSLDKYIF